MRACLDPGCDQLVSRGRCPEHAAIRDKAIHSSDRKDLYNSKRWKGMRRVVFREQNGLCAVEGCMQLAHDLDHINPLRDGGDKWDRRNLQGLCSAHHARKTIRETIHFK